MSVPAMTNSTRPARPWLGLGAWIAFTFLASLTGLLVAAEGWYNELAKPPWTPPAWLFGPVWTLLYLLMAVSAWRIWLQGGWSRQAGVLRLYLAQWALNAAWTPLFFGLRQPGLACAEIAALFCLLFWTVRRFWTVDRAAALLLGPYLAWVGFAGVLNWAIWRLN